MEDKKQQKPTSIKKHIRFVFILVFLLFTLNKLYIRSLVLESNLPHFMHVLVLSFPNTAEAIMGTLVLTGILLTLQHTFPEPFRKWKLTRIYLIAVVFSALYVITQEFKLHNLGGNNVYDPNDVVASIIGLGFIYWLLMKYGFANYKT